MRLPRWVENRLDFLAKESVYGRGLDTGVFIGRQHRELEILELLEEHIPSWNRFDKCVCGEVVESFRGHAIALIKGEGK